MTSPRATTKGGSSRAGLFEVLERVPARADELRSLLPTLDAPRLIDACARHGVSAWVSDALLAAGLESADATRLHANARENFALGYQTKRLTLAVLDTLATVGIRPVALKGAVLAHRLYQPIPLSRPSSDVDVLVHPSELERAGQALGGLGLRRWQDTSLGDVLDDHHHVAFQGAAGLVEVHFRLTSSFGRGTFDDDAVRSRLIELSFEGRPVRLLGREDEFLYLATHAANHAFLRASWLVDLARFFELHPGLDFEAIAQRAADAGFLHAVSISLRLLERLLHVEFPAQARRAFPRRRVRGLVDATVFRTPNLETGLVGSSKLGSFAARLWMVDSLGHGARHVVDGMMRAVRREWSKR